MSLTDNIQFYCFVFYVSTSHQICLCQILSLCGKKFGLQKLHSTDRQKQTLRVAFCQMCQNLALHWIPWKDLFDLFTHSIQ